MDTALQAILRTLFNFDFMIESTGDLSVDSIAIGYCVFDDDTVSLCRSEFSSVIEIYGDPFTDDNIGKVFFVSYYDSGSVYYERFSTVESAETFYTFNRQVLGYSV